MNQDTHANSEESELPTMSISTDPLADLLKCRVLDEPARPGLLANIDRFEVLSHLGTGGMGIVFLARDPQTNNRVAVKVLKPEFVQNESMVHRFLREGRHMEGLEHSHIINVLEVSDRTHGPYFVMPYMAGGSLADRIKQDNALDLETTLRYARTIGEALSYAHSRGLIHRDLKPGNVLIDGNGEAYLTDFGLVRDFSINDSLLDVRRPSVVGTAPFMSPAVAAGKPEDTRCDIYGFGALLYVMMTGCPPYDGQRVDQVIHQVIAGPPTPIQQRKPDADPNLAKMVEHAMARELRDRYATMTDALADLDRVQANQSPLGPHGQGEFSKRLKQIPRAKRITTGLVVALVITLLATLWMFWSPRDQAIENDGPFSVAPNEFLFEDSFSGDLLNPDLWRWGQKDFSYQGLGQNNHAQLSQRNGSVYMTAHAESVRGWTSNRHLWLESELDLRKHGDALIAVELDVEASRGSLSLMISDHTEPKVATIPDVGQLWQAGGDQHHPLKMPLRRWEGFLHSASQSVLVVEPADSATTHRLIDISSLSSWHLGVRLMAITSAGFGPGDVKCHLHRAAVGKVDKFTCVWGKVVDEETGEPIPNAVVRNDNKVSCLTDGRGMFVLPLIPAQRTLLTVTGNKLELAKPSPVFRANMGEQVETVLKVRTKVVKPIILPGNRIDDAFDLTNEHVYFSDQEDGKSMLMRMSRADGKPEKRFPVPPPSGLVRTDEAIYAVTNWPGRLYKFDEEGNTSPVVTPLEHTQWPYGLAFDGKRLWHLEIDAGDNNSFGVYAIDPATAKPLQHFVSGDSKLKGIAWHNGRLWISSAAGVIYEVDTDKAIAGGTLEAGMIRRIPGDFTALSWAEGQLWALDPAKRQLQIISTEGKPDG